jgi:uroporphyrinogen decarboxylase
MQLRQCVLDAIRHRDVRPVPYTLGFEGDVAERVDAHYGSQAWRQRLTPYMVGVAAVQTDIREPISDTHVRDGYGGIWRTDRRPFYLEQPPLTKPSFQGYDFPKPERFLRPEWRERAVKTCAEHPDQFRVGHLGWGLFERSWNLRGFENILMDAIDEPAFFEEVLDRLTELYLAFVKYTVELPIDAILFGDDWGDQRGVILGPDRWRQFIKPRWQRVYGAVHAAGKIVMAHSCGSVAEIMPDIIEIGMDVLESVQPEAAGMNPYELKARWGERITFWGCLGSQSTIPFGTPTSIKAEVSRLCREVGRGGGFILAPAKALQPETPTENAVAVIEAFTNQES